MTEDFPDDQLYQSRDVRRVAHLQRDAGQRIAEVQHLAVDLCADTFAEDPLNEALCRLCGFTKGNAQSHRAWVGVMEGQLELCREAVLEVSSMAIGWVGRVGGGRGSEFEATLYEICGCCGNLGVVDS